MRNTLLIKFNFVINMKFWWFFFFKFISEIILFFGKMLTFYLHRVRGRNNRGGMKLFIKKF